MQKQKLGQDEQKPTASPHLGLTSVLLLPQGAACCFFITPSPASKPNTSFPEDGDLSQFL